MFFLTGTDEHGVKMLQTAKKQGITPAELADRNTPRFRDMVAALDFSNDDFIRTTRGAPQARLPRSCGGAWRQNGDIYLDKYAGWYSVRDEAYYDESETEAVRRRRQKLSPQGDAGRVGRGGELFLPAVGLSGQAARPLRGAPRVHRSGHARRTK